MGCRQANLACNHPITDWGNQTSYPNMLSAKVSYPSMHSVNQKPGKLDTLSQHAVEANHNMGKLDTLSQHTQHKPCYPSIHCTKLTCIKEAAKAQNDGQADKSMCCITKRTRAMAEQVATTPWETGQEA